MESLSPYKSMVGDDERPKSEQIAAELPENDNYVDLVLAHLQTTGVKSRLRDDRIEFDSIEPALGRTLTAVGIRKNADEGTNSRLGIALGPEYATVDQLFIKNAAREALAAKGVGMLLILGYAFDPTALEAVSDLKPEDASDFAEVVRQRTIGKMPVLLVRMNPELAMGNELKNTGAGSLFTVFGEPDVEVKDLGDGTFCMKILGIDTYNTKTGEVRSDSPDDIMLWTLDTDYNSEAFVVRHAYFSGKDGKPSGMDPYKQLKKALKADVDEEAWASLYRTESRAFPKPTTGKIAVKVVDRYGNEVLKVIEV
jgi:adenine-specific DNA-methyltransferase